MLIVYIIYSLSYIRYGSSRIYYDDYLEDDKDISDQRSLEIDKEMSNEILNSRSLEVPTTAGIADKSKGNIRNALYPVWTARIERVDRPRELVNTSCQYHQLQDEPKQGNITPTPKRIGRYDNSFPDEHYRETNVENIDEDKCRSTLINYPFAVSIQKKGAHYTTGALLNKNWILTTGGEFYFVRDSLKLFKARLGSVDCKSGGSLLPLKEVHIHPSYVPKSPDYDLALLRTGVPVEFTEYVKPIALSPVKEKILSARFMTVYWPRLIVNGKTLPPSAKERLKYNSMRVSTQKLIPWEKCSRKIETKGKDLLESSLCIKPVTVHHSICMPDSGAPVVAEYKLWGITSGWTSKNCSSNPSPTVCTRLSSHLVSSWLDSVVLKEATDFYL